MKSIAEETRGTGLVVSGVLPGSVDTEMLHGSGFEPAMTAADVASKILYLGVDAPAAVHGSAVEMFG
jgi:short-subunit dehydrogenase